MMKGLSLKGASGRGRPKGGKIRYPEKDTKGLRNKKAPNLRSFLTRAPHWRIIEPVLPGFERDL